MVGIMKILVENGCYDLQNMGDVAMLQVAVERLRQLWPDALIQVITARPDLLARYCPDARAIPAAGRCGWFYDRNILGKLHNLMPRSLDHSFTELTRSLRRLKPNVMHNLLMFKAKIHQRNINDVNLFIDAVFDADLIALSGGGDINDSFSDFAFTLFEILELAIQRGIPTVLFGQGIGPINNPTLKKRAAEVLPLVDLIAIREKLTSLPLLESLNVPRRKIIVSGDDAIELAYKNHSAKSGSAIGVNIRVSSYSGIDSHDIESIRGTLWSLAEEHRASLLPVPISFYAHESDIEAARKLIGGKFSIPESCLHLNDPLDIVNLIRDCRVVVTGSYHSAVFALAQGIPAVCIARSEYYKDKFMGLMSQFKTPGDVIFWDDDQRIEMLHKAIDKAWKFAEHLKPCLLKAAKRQITSSKNAYNQAYRILEAKKEPVYC